MSIKIINKLKTDLTFLREKLFSLKSLHSTYNYISIGVASAERIKNWTKRRIAGDKIIGEILHSQKVENDKGHSIYAGLFCQEIFGPVEEYTCSCKKYIGKFGLKYCEICRVELTSSRVRRHRMGYIELINPIAHLWFFNKTSNYIGIFLNCNNNNPLSIQTIQDFLYYKSFTPDQVQEFSKYFKNLKPRPIIGYRKLTKEEFFMGIKLIEKLFFEKDYDNNEEENYDISNDKKENNEEDDKKNKFGITFADIVFFKGARNFERPPILRCMIFRRVISGTEFFKNFLDTFNLKKEIIHIREKIADIHVKETRVLKSYLYLYNLNIFLQKLRILESFVFSKINPGNFILTVLPILSPLFRPITLAKKNIDKKKKKEKKTVSSMLPKLNETYSDIMENNTKLTAFLIKNKIDSYLSTSVKRNLQECIDKLLGDSHKKSKIENVEDQKSERNLLSILEGKFGYFRQYLLGKRVDYSGRSVIISGPGLNFNQCGLPFEILVKLLEPQVIKILSSLYPGKEILEFETIDNHQPFIFTIIKKLIKKQPILLNRAPTLHKYGVQSFDILIVLTKNIYLHPLVCSSYNADFDGDQMGIHLPLSKVSQMELIELLRPFNFLFSSSNSGCIFKPTQDMIMGCYYMTFGNNIENSKKFHWFSTAEKAIQEFLQKKISLHSLILIKKKTHIFNLFFEKKKLYLYNQHLCPQKIAIYIKKILKSKNCFKKTYLLTNLGIFICTYDSKLLYKISNFFVQTTIGRLFFEQNFSNIFQDFSNF